MPDINPITRAEALLDGENIEPLTRLEYFLKKAGEGGGGQTILDKVSKSGIIESGPLSITFIAQEATVICPDVEPSQTLDTYNIRMKINGVDQIFDELVEDGTTFYHNDNYAFYVAPDESGGGLPIMSWYGIAISGEAETIVITDFEYYGDIYNLVDDGLGLPGALFKNQSFLSLLDRYIGG